MLKVWSLKKDEETAKKRKPKTSPAQLRVQKGASVVQVVSDACVLTPTALVSPSADLTEMELPGTMRTEFPDPSDVLNFKLTIDPDEGVSALAQAGGL